MILSPNEIKGYLRLDEDYTDEDDELTSLAMAAENYLINAGCILSSENELAKLAIKILVVHWYENREPIGKADRLAFGLDNIIIQLKYCYSAEGD